MLEDTDRLKYRILSEVCVSEPFFILVRNVNWEDKVELGQFIEVLCSMLKEGHLTVKTWYSNNILKTKDIRPEDLFRYISMRQSKGERLDDVPNEFEYEFVLTSKGVDFIDEIDRRGK